MISFKSVKGKLSIVSLSAIISSVVLVGLIFWFSNKQTQFTKIDQTNFKLQLQLSKFPLYIDNLVNFTLKTDVALLEKEYKTVSETIVYLSKQLDDQSIESVDLKPLQKQLENFRIIFNDIAVSKNQLQKNIAKMEKTSQSLNDLFVKSYDYKLMQYMMNLSLIEKNYILKIAQSTKN